MITGKDYGLVQFVHVHDGLQRIIREVGVADQSPRLVVEAGLKEAVRLYECVNSEQAGRVGVQD